MFEYKGIIVKERKDYLTNPRSKVTTTIRTDYFEAYKEMMSAIDVEMCKGYDILLEMLSEDKAMLDTFLDKVRKY